MREIPSRRRDEIDGASLPPNARGLLVLNLYMYDYLRQGGGYAISAVCLSVILSVCHCAGLLQK